MQEFLRVNETVRELCGRCSNASAFDCSEDAMLACALGPRRLPLTLVVPVTALSVVVFLAGVVGNALVCAVIAAHPSMHSDTDYYLLSLAISHLLLLVFGLPDDLSAYWRQYPYSLGVVFCKLRAFIYEAASYASVLTLVAVTLVRYLAVCRPLRSPVMAGVRRTTGVVLALWGVALLAASPFALYTSISYLEYPPGSGHTSLESASCGMLDLSWWRICELNSFFFFFLLPGGIIIYLHVQMCLNIRATLERLSTPAAFVNAGAHDEVRQAYSHREVIRILAVVTVVFFVSWGLVHVQRLFQVFGVGSEHYYAGNERLCLVASTCYYVAATVNHTLYKMMSHRYKLSTKEMLSLCRRRGQAQRRRLYTEIFDLHETIINRTSGFSLKRVRGSDFREPSYTWLCPPRDGVHGATYEVRALRDPRRDENVHVHRYTFEAT